MSAPASMPAELLRFYADLAEKHDFEPITRAGDDLQRAFIEFLRTGAGNEADPLDMLADLLALIPRFHNALVQANHRGVICRRCSERYAAMLFDGIIQDASELASLQAIERKH